MPDAEWRAHGILPPAEHVASTQQALRELVVPISRALLRAQPALREGGEAPDQARA